MSANEALTDDQADADVMVIVRSMSADPAALTAVKAEPTKQDPPNNTVVLHGEKARVLERQAAASPRQV